MPFLQISPGRLFEGQLQKFQRMDWRHIGDVIMGRRLFKTYITGSTSPVWTSWENVLQATGKLTLISLWDKDKT